FPRELVGTAVVIGDADVDRVRPAQIAVHEEELAGQVALWILGRHRGSYRPRRAAISPVYGDGPAVTVAGVRESASSGKQGLSGLAHWRRGARREIAQGRELGRDVDNVRLGHGERAVALSVVHGECDIESAGSVITEGM